MRSETAVASPPKSRAPSPTGALTNASSTDMVLLEEPKRLSESILWDLQRAYFETQGAGAWSQAVVPHFITSNPFIAHSYARQVFAFLSDLETRGEATEEPLYIVELAAGSGRFSFHFLTAWRELLRKPGMNGTGSQPGLAPSGQRFCYVMTDVAESNLAAWQRQPQLAELAELGILDFARFDLEQDHRLELRHSGVELDRGGLGNPLVAIANYAFDSIRQDAFAVQDGQLLECRLVLSAPAEAAKRYTDGDGSSLDALHIAHDYHPVELPYYHEEPLDSLLEDYRRELGSGHVLLPIHALRSLRALAALSRRGLMLLSGDMGYNHLDDLRGAGPPQATRHGSVAFKVAYHAIGRCVENLGGLARQPRLSASSLAVNAFFLGFAEADLGATLTACDEALEGLGPDGYFVLKGQLDEHRAELSFDQILAYLKLSRWDASTLQICMPRLLEIATEGLATPQKEALRLVVERTWAGYFRLGDRRDLAFDLGTLLVAAGLHSAAPDYFEYSRQHYGEHSATYFNLALCLAREERWDEALSTCRRALELDAGNHGAADLRRQITAAKGGGNVAIAGLTAAAKPPVVPSSEPAAYGDNLAHLQGELAVLNLRLEKEVTRWRATHPPETTSDQLMGLELTDLGADLTLASLRAGAAARERLDAEEEGVAPSLAPCAALHTERERAALDAGVPLRLHQLAQRMGLDDFERAVVMLALASELDPRYERLFGYLNDDMARRWPSVELTLRLFCSEPTEFPRRRRSFDPDAPLLTHRLLILINEGVERTLRTRGLRLEERTAKFLLEGSDSDPMLAGYTQQPNDDGASTSVPPAIGDASVRDEVIRLAAYLAERPEPPPILNLAGPDALLMRRLSTYLVGGDGMLILRGTAVAAAEHPQDLVARALREVELTGRALVVEDAAALGAEGLPTLALHHLLTVPCRRPRVLLAAERWPLPDPCLPVPVLALQVPAPDSNARQELWRDALAGLATDVDLAEIAGRFNLRSAQIAGAAGRVRARLASQAATGKGHRVSGSDIFAACRAQSLESFEGLAQRIESFHDWEDLVLPSRTKDKLKSLERWLRYRHRVFDDWGFAERVMIGRGMAALFSGSSGTGKTMAAGIIARSLDLDIYRIDLSSVVSKFVGETEKNLARIFDAAESANAVLFFDEADALFGKRSQVKDSHDRYANIEVSYLLQRMENYTGIAILATNLRDHLDAAFTRRLQLLVEFPFPKAEGREHIWRRLLSEKVPLAEDVDLEFLARQFNLAGGSIKNCAIDAALMAAEEEEPVTMRHLVGAVARELEKTGKPMTAALFGVYGGLVS